MADKATYKEQGTRPSEVLDALSTLRMEKARIKPLVQSHGSAKGKKTDATIPAELVPSESTEPSDSVDVQTVAVKKLLFDGDSDDARALALLAHEVHMLNDLSHANIVKVIGFVEDVKNSVAWIVVPWEKNGNLREFISSGDWEFSERLALLYDIANGINYLHSREPPICHGELTSLKIIVNPENQAVITGFGAPRHLALTPGEDEPPKPPVEPGLLAKTSPLEVEVEESDTRMKLTGSKWVISWVAPESLLNGSAPDLASDIWTFGGICWEALTGTFPFVGTKDVSTELENIEGKLPELSGDGHLDQAVALANLMVECWNLDPTDRPTAQACKSKVDEMDRTEPATRSETESPEIHSAQLLLSLGFMNMGRSRVSEAVEQLQGAMDAAELSGNDRIVGAANYALGEVSRMRGDLAKAKEHFLVARDRYTRIDNQLGLTTAVKSLGDVFRVRGEFAKAEESYITARDAYARIGQQAGVANSIKALGILHGMQGDNDKAEECYIEARDIFSQIGDEGGLADALNGLGDAYSSKGEYSKAEESYMASRDIHARMSYLLGVANSSSGLGELYRIQGQNAKAEESFSDARDIFSRMGNQSGVARVTKALGDIYDAQDDNSKAEESYIAARDIYARIGDQSGLANVLKALGGVYRAQRDYSRAEKSYIGARDIYARIGNRRGLAMAITGLGQLFSNQEDYTKAEQAYQEAREIFEGVGDKYSLAGNMWYTGLLRRSQGRVEEAQNSVLEARNLFEECGVEDYVSMCDEFLAAAKE